MSARFVSYAQNREDVVLARALCPDGGEGFYVDVGAGHPVYDSVTKAFSDRGWRGVNVEPLVEEHALLASSRPRDINLNVAVGAVGGVAKLYEGPPDNRGSSTSVPELAEAYRGQGQDFVAREVRMRTLASIADEHISGPVDFLKVDVEGMEREVLVGADWEWFRPRVVVVEATVPNSTEPSHESWEPLLLSAGYWFALFDGINRFYVRDDEPALLELIAAPANVLDDYEVHTWLDRVPRQRGPGRATAGRPGRLAPRADRVGAAHPAAGEPGRGRGRDDRRAHRCAGGRAVPDRQHARGPLGARLPRAHALQFELDALLGTKTFRHTAKLRDRYARVREMARRFGA